MIILSDCAYHLSIPQPERHPHVLEEAEGDGGGCLLHIRWVDWNLKVPPSSGQSWKKNVQPVAFTAISSILGSW
jgi:hypothetical protein